MHLLLVHSFLLAISVAHASASIDDPQFQQPYRTATVASASYTCSASCDSLILTPQPLPDPSPSTSFGVQLQTGVIPGLSIPHRGSFFGFSIELNVVTQIFGLNSSFLQVPFLNLMANIRQRAGSVYVRVVNNTQDCTIVIDSMPDSPAFSSDFTPPLIFTPEIIELMAQISSLTNVHWYLDAPVGDTLSWRPQVTEAGESILGDHVVGLQAGNEPDLHSRNGDRSSTYSPNDYKDKFGQAVQASDADPSIPEKDLPTGPRQAVWQHKSVLDTGFIINSQQKLVTLVVERYPTDNRYAQYGISSPRTAQEMLPSSLTHKSEQRIVSEYLGSTAYAQTQGLPFPIFETNTASRGGFPSLNDCFTAALWAIDYSLQMAYANFTRAMFHVGGQSDCYNPFTPPLTNQSTFHQWMIGPVYYSSLFVAEALGSSNQSQVLDLQMNSDEFTPGYAIYENGRPTRVALINFVNDNFGARDYIASISIGGTVPSQVRVKYLLASSVAQKYNITWAGQTFGDAFSSDGRPVGVVDVQTVDCNQINNVCNVKVPAPGAALVFLSDQELAESDEGPTMMIIHWTKLYNTTTVDTAALAMSDGNKGIADALAGTGQGRGSSATFGLTHALSGVNALIAGAVLVPRVAMRW